jgi:hypothetical protein
MIGGVNGPLIGAAAAVYPGQHPGPCTSGATEADAWTVLQIEVVTAAIEEMAGRPSGTLHERAGALE